MFVINLTYKAFSSAPEVLTNGRDCLAVSILIPQKKKKNLDFALGNPILQPFCFKEFNRNRGLEGSEDSSLVFVFLRKDILRAQM